MHQKHGQSAILNLVFVLARLRMRRLALDRKVRFKTEVKAWLSQKFI